MTELITENEEISVNILATKLNVSRRTILRDIERLKHQNILKRVGKAKGGHWQIIEQ